MTKSYRIKLDDKPYVFGAYPGIVLGAGLTDPGRPTEVGSAAIQSFHPGIGNGLVNGMMKYLRATSIDPTIPGVVVPDYSDEPVDDDTGDAVLMRPKLFFCPGDDYNRAFLISGTHIYQFSPTDPSSGMTDLKIWGGANEGDPLETELTGDEFSGSAFAFGNRVFFGTIWTDGPTTNSNFAPYPHWYINLLADPSSSPGNGVAHGARKISYAGSTRGRAFFIGENPNSALPTLYWALENPDIAAQDFDGDTQVFPSTGAGFAVGHPHVSWVAMAGRTVVVFRSDGVILAADESGLLSIAGRIALSDPDPNFGQGATLYQDGLLIPSGSGLYSLDMQTLTLRPASGNYIQNQNEERLRGEITACAAIGPYAFIGVAGPERKGRLYRLVRYSNLMAYHDFLPAELEQYELVTDVFPYFDREAAMYRIYYVVFNENTKAIALRFKWMRTPADSGTDNTPEDGTLEMASFPGATPQGLALKLWTQVRGHWEPGVVGDPDTTALNFNSFTVDGETVNIAQVTDQGAFVRPITVSPGDENNLVGREMKGTIAFANALPDTELRLPLVFDYIWCPSAANACVLNLLVSGEVNGEANSLRIASPWATTKDLLALRNTVVPLEFPEGDTWTVLVEDIQIPDIVAPDSDGQTARVAKVQVRRLA